MTLVFLFVDLIAIVAFLAILLGVIFFAAAISLLAAVNDQRRGRGRSTYLVPKVFAGIGSVLILGSTVALAITDG